MLSDDSMTIQGQGGNIMLRFTAVRFVVVVVLALVTTLAFAAAENETGLDGTDFPTRSIRYIVPWAADNESVAMARIIAAEMSEVVGGNIVVFVNRNKHNRSSLNVA